MNKIHLRVYTPYKTCCIHPVFNFNFPSISLQRIGFIHWHYMCRLILNHAIIGKLYVTINQRFVLIFEHKHVDYHWHAAIIYRQCGIRGFRVQMGVYLRWPVAWMNIKILRDITFLELVPIVLAFYMLGNMLNRENIILFVIMFH